MLSEQNGFIGSSIIDLPTIEHCDKSSVLTDLTFAVKDVIDVAGLVTGCGNPQWVARREVALEHAPCVKALLAAGACFKGKTICDEMAFSLDGENIHYGTPVNPKAPGCIPGGSSSGSAVAVASGAVDFSLGTDTAGSVRVPAAFCGIYGIRSSHGRIPIQGIHPLAPSLDCVGWFARDAHTLAQVGEVFLADNLAPNKIQAKPTKTLFSITNFHQPLTDSIAHYYQAQWHKFHAVDIAIETITLPINQLKLYSQVLKQIQWWQLQLVHGAWIAQNLDSFADEIASRLAQLKTVDQYQYDIAIEQQQQLKLLLSDFIRREIGNDAIMLMPTTPHPAPALARTIAEIRRFRTDLIEYTALTSLMGWPQLSMPLALDDNQLPIGLSLLALDGQDENLLACAKTLSSVMG